MILVEMEARFIKAVVSGEIKKFYLLDLYDSNTDKHKAIELDDLNPEKLSRKEFNAVLLYMRDLVLNGV